MSLDLEKFQRRQILLDSVKHTASRAGMDFLANKGLANDPASANAIFVGLISEMIGAAFLINNSACNIEPAPPPPKGQP